jgi:hypothetical protein
MNLPIIPHDKALHFIYGLAVGVVSYNAAIKAGFAGYAVVIGFLAAAVVGAAKEGLDWLLNKRAVKAGLPAPHTVSLPDAIATAAGGAVLWFV